MGFRRSQPDVNVSRLSKSSKLFFLLNIMQVVIVGGIQSSMMYLGDYSSISTGGMGPGRRVYMGLFAGAVVYSCFLCLFAVKNENFLEIIAFVVQNFGYIVYSSIQVYHINYKTYEDIEIRKSKQLSVLSFLNFFSLLVMNAMFTYLAFKLFVEYGWKIYKRVRFNIKLRAAYHFYELVICLMKMTILFVVMFSICLNRTIFRGLESDANFIVTLAIIPTFIIVCRLAVAGIHRENKVIMTMFVVVLLVAQAGYIYEIHSIATCSSTYCKNFFKKKNDVPQEVVIHILYLGSVALLFVFVLALASVKVTRNFGIGLRSHFTGSTKSSTILILGLSQGIVSSIILNSSVQKESTLANIHAITQEENDSISSDTSEKTRSSITEDFDGCNKIGSKRNIFDEISTLSNFASNKCASGALLDVDFPPNVKSSSLHAKIPTQQRASVIARLSKQATEKLNTLYIGSSASTDTIFKESCCLPKKRKSSDAYLPAYCLPTVYENLFRQTGTSRTASRRTKKKKSIHDVPFPGTRKTAIITPPMEFINSFSSDKKRDKNTFYSNSNAVIVDQLNKKPKKRKLSGDLLGLRQVGSQIENVSTHYPRNRTYSDTSFASTRSLISDGQSSDIRRRSSSYSSISPNIYGRSSLAAISELTAIDDVFE